VFYRFTYVALGASFPIPRPNGDIRCMKSKEFQLFRRELSSLVRRTSMTSSWVAIQIFVELIICFFLNIRTDNTAGQPRTKDHLPMPTHSQPLDLKIIYFPQKEYLGLDFQEFSLSHARERGVLDESSVAVTRHQFAGYIHAWLYSH
jgi:hypothetical protein